MLRAVSCLGLAWQGSGGVKGAASPDWDETRHGSGTPGRRRRLPGGQHEGQPPPITTAATTAVSSKLPFYLLNPERLSIGPWEAATKEGAAKAGRKVAAAELPSVDLVVCGSVAVNRQGARIGKGGGFSDLEVAFLVEAGVIRPDTILATTVHPLQVVNEPLRETIHDFRVDLILTPDEAIWCAEPHRPPGILWEHLDQDKIAEVPALAALAAGR